MKIVDYSTISFALPPLDKFDSILPTLITNFSAGICNDQRLNTQNVKNLIQSAVTNLRSLSPSQDYRAFTKLKKVKADKGETLILSQRCEYDRRIYDFLTSANAVVDTTFNPESYKKTIYSVISSASRIIPEEKKDSTRTMCVSTPCLYGQIKTHKEGYPMLYVVACYTTHLLPTIFQNILPPSSVYTLVSLLYTQSQTPLTWLPNSSV